MHSPDPTPEDMGRLAKAFHKLVAALSGEPMPWQPQPKRTTTRQRLTKPKVSQSRRKAKRKAQRRARNRA